MKNELVLGAIIGDILGSPYEHLPFKPSNIDISHPDSVITDDSILTIATMDCLLHSSENFEDYYMEWGNKFIDRPIWGGNFKKWLRIWDSKRINHSYGNGCLMRISPIAYNLESLDECKRLAVISCQYTHNYAESFIAALKYVNVLYCYKHGWPEETLGSDRLSNNYDLYKNSSMEKDLIDCSIETVNQAYSSFLEGENFLDCVSKAIKLGGDTDTIGAMTGALAETIYQIPEDLVNLAKDRLDSDMWDIVVKFSRRFNNYLG